MPLALTLPPEAPGPVQPARPLGETAAHMPPAGGAAGVGWAGAPRRAAAAASWGRPGGRMRSCDRAGAQLSESAGKLRGSAAARSAARVAGSGQRRLHARSGRRASFGPSPAPRAPGHGGAAAAAAAGVPRAPGRPSLHRGSPRAHWPRRGDHRGGVPCGLPSHRPPHTPRAPDREGAEGRGPAPHRPARRRGLAPSQRYPASPRVPERSAVLQNRSCRVGPCGWGGGRGRKGAAAPLPGGSRGSTLPMEGRGAWPPPLFARRARTQLAFGGSGKPSRSRVFPTTISPRPEIELGPGLASVQKWKSW